MAKTAKNKPSKKWQPSSRRQRLMALVMVGLLVFSALAAYRTWLSSAATNGYNPDPYCFGHVTGYLFADGTQGGGSAANKITDYNKNSPTWVLSSGGKVKTRFARCAEKIKSQGYVVNPGAAKVIENSSSVRLENFQFVGGFDIHELPAAVRNGSLEMRRAFLMSVLEMDGPGTNATTNNPTKLFDHSKSDFPRDDPEYYLHIFAIRDLAGLIPLPTAFLASADGKCTEKTAQQVQNGNSNGVCIRSNDWPVFKSWPFAKCERIPGWTAAKNGEYNCGGTDATGGGSGGGVTAPSVDISVSPATITSGQTATLSWNVGGSSPSCTASGGWSGSKASSGSQNIQPSATATYTLTCSNSAGSQAKSATLTVNTPPVTSAPNVTLTQSPANPVALGTDTLRYSWNAPGATSCTNPAGGSVNGSSGSWSKPTAVSSSDNGRQFSVTCSNSAGSNSKSLTLSVNIPPETPSPVINAFNVSSNSAKKGERVIFSWNVGNAEYCELTPRNKPQVTAQEGSWTSSTLDQVKTYTFSFVCFNGSKQSETRTQNVVVTDTPPPPQPAVINSFNAQPTELAEGDVLKLSWNASASRCSLIGTPVNPVSGSSLSAIGELEISGLKTSNSYTLTCVRDGVGGNASRSVEVKVNGNPAPTPPPATDPTPPPSGGTDDSGSNAVVIDPVTNTPVTDAEEADIVDGLVSLDSTNITDEQKRQALIKVEYYVGDELVYTADKAPFALDTTVLPDGTYNVTERSYFNDGTVLSKTSELTIDNDTGFLAGMNWLAIIGGSIGSMLIIGVLFLGINAYVSRPRWK